MKPTDREVPFRAAVIIMGASGLVAQMSLLRELLIVAAGNEMTIGIILANWLVIEAAGAAIGGRLESGLLRRTAVFAVVTALFCISLPAALYGVRILKPALGLSIGEIPGLAILFVASFVLLLPTSLTHGALFPMACGSAPGSLRNSIIGRVYLLETGGTLLGGLLWTWVLIPHFHSFEIAVVVAIFNGAVCLTLFSGRGSMWRTDGGLGIAAVSLSAVVLLGGVAMLAAGGASRLHARSITEQWQGQQVVEYRNSVHGNIVVVENQSQYSFFTDGTLTLLVPFPDTAYVKTYPHIPLTAHPDPRRVLLIGGGPGGVIYEMLKHTGISRIDYAELDPLLVESLRTHPTPLTEAELGSPRVSVKLTDGRSHLVLTRERYDVVVSMLSDPSDLQTNRFFTREFFELVERRLSEEGILVVKLPGALAFTNQALADLMAVLHEGLAAVFPHIRVFPGDGETMAIASTSPAIMDYDVETLLTRLETRGLMQGVALPWEIERRLHPGWQDWFRNLVSKGGGRPNRDFAPFGVFQSLTYWSSLHAPELVPVLQLLRRTRPWMVAGILLLAAIVVGGYGLVVGRGGRLSIAPCIFGTGVAGMVFSLSLIFAFQSLFGHLFSWIGLLTAVFMAGATAGALLMTRHLGASSRRLSVRREMVASEMAILATAALLPVILPAIRPLLEQTGAFALLRSVFLILPFLCGLLTGAQFPLAGRLREEETGHTTSTAGTLYAADLAGGWLGGMLGGVFLLPVLGLVGTGLSIALLKLTTLSLFSLSFVRWKSA